MDEQTENFAMFGGTERDMGSAEISVSDDSNPLMEAVLELAMRPNLPWSDLKIEGERPIMMNVPAGWVRVSDEVFSQRDMLASLAAESLAVEDVKKGAVSKPLSLPSHRLRLMFYGCHGGTSLGVAVRRQPLAPLSLEASGLPRDIIRAAIEEPRGLFVVAGATSSGKTSTIATMLDAINRYPGGNGLNVLTIEDPIEYRFVDARCSFSQREVGQDVSSFCEGAREAMRMSPNIVVIGEVRDKDTAEAALNLAESGHFVIASLHGESTTGALSRLLNFFPTEERAGRLQALTSVLVGAIWQMLMPSSDGSRRVLAAEVLGNIDGWVSGVVGNGENGFSRLEEMLSSNEAPGGSVSALKSVVSLVQQEKVTNATALRSLGFGMQQKLRAALAVPPRG